jgi:hypothetical protein
LTKIPREITEISRIAVHRVLSTSIKRNYVTSPVKLNSRMSQRKFNRQCDMAMRRKFYFSEVSPLFD